MAPSKTDVGVVEGSEEGQQVDSEDVSSVTSSLTRLTLQTDTHKDIAKVEEGLAHISLKDAPEKEEDIKKTEEKEEEKVTEEERKEVVKEEKEEEKKEENEKVEETESLKEEGKKKEDKEEVEEKEQEEEEKEEQQEKEEDKKISVVKEAEEKKEDKEDKKKEEEEEVSDDENPADDGAAAPPEDKKLRSRGFGGGDFMSSQHMGYMTDYQQQQYQALQSPFLQAPNSYSRVWGPTHGEIAGYPGASPTGGSLESDDNVSNISYGYSAESPYQEVPYASPYVDSQASPYSQSLSLSPQYQTQASPYNQGLSHSPQYQNQASPYNNSLLASPQYPELASQDSPFTTAQMSPYYSAAGAQPGLLTPPISPEPVQTPTSNSLAPENEIVNIITSVLEQDNFDISPQDSNIIEITRGLLDIGSSSHSDLEEELNSQLYEQYYRQYAVLKDESLVQGDEDGDILYLTVACTGQMEHGYKEKLVAFTKRVEKMHLCCKKVVDWRIMRCQTCGKSDPRTFYSPLSWKNNLDQMLLSNLVLLRFPAPVIEYITKRVMVRPMDFQRTFTTHYELFQDNTELYPCLLQGLQMLNHGM